MVKWSKDDSETNGDSETTIQKLFPPIPNLSRFRNYESETIAIQKLSRFRNHHDSETIAIQKVSRFRNYDSETTTIQKLRFRNYDSETIAIQKLRFRNDRVSEMHASETIAIQKVSRFRNDHDSEAIALHIAIQKLRFRNDRDSETTIQKRSRFRNYDSETITIQKLWRFRNYRPSETKENDIKIPTRMELQIDLDCPQG